MVDEYVKLVGEGERISIAVLRAELAENYHCQVSDSRLRTCVKDHHGQQGQRKSAKARRR